MIPRVCGILIAGVLMKLSPLARSSPFSEDLTVIHRLFFNPKFEAGLQYGDVRYIFARHDVLRGCTLSFKHIFTPDFRPENLRLWLMAEELGAKFSTDNLIKPITRGHLVCHSGGVSGGRARRNYFGPFKVATCLLLCSHRSQHFTSPHTSKHGFRGENSIPPCSAHSPHKGLFLDCGNGASTTHPSSYTNATLMPGIRKENGPMEAKKPRASRKGR
ncbi:rna polymerase ii c-terminal domain phosphatase-like 4 [Quercus suber]|uniref:Rna polymerase ii c-terminal domain phosphatase-like 4 n=1 Tax=Quercus suber TaxID=58331 RepID=A0AAW0L538_QUESU